MNEVSHKDFVAILAMATAAATVPAAAGAAVPPAPQEMAQMNMGGPDGGLSLTMEPEAYTSFTEPEAAVIEAAVERLMPTDNRGPGAKQAGVAFFIDRQLVGAYGTAAKVYRNGSWLQGTPQQGHQLRQTPAELYKQAIAALQAYCNATYQMGFAQLTPAQQDTVLHGLDAETITFAVAPAKVWFETLLQNTLEGYFSDPLYGGNRDKVGWKLVGFPGVAANYADKITQHNVPYRGNYLDLDPTYTNFFGLPLMRLTFDWGPHEHKYSDFAAQKIEMLAKALSPKSHVVNRLGDHYHIVPYQSTHNTGGAIMGSDPSTSVVNAYQQV